MTTSTKTRGPRKPADTSKITMLVDANPKRKGSKSAARFNLYRKAKNVGELVAAYVAKGLSPRLAYLDLEWDIDHEFVKVAA